MTLSVLRIPHNDQRYDTCGDWTWDGDDLTIRVSILPEPKYEILIVVHELIEAVLCTRAGITQAQVDEFDMMFDGPGEPGDHPYAPYHTQHVFATRIENLLCEALGLNWDAYNTVVDGLEYAKRPA